MSADTRAIHAPNLVLGLCLMIVGAVLALDRMHLLEASHVLRFWPIALILFGVSMVVQTFGRGRERAPAAKEEGRPRFHGGHVVGIVLMGVLISHALTGSDRVDRSSETVSLVGVLTGHQYVSETANFRGGDMTSVMGNCTLDLRQAMLASGQDVTIDVFTLMGGLVLRVPDGWTVDVRAVPFMGGIRDRRGGASERQARGRRAAESDEPSPPFVAEQPPASRGDGKMPRLVVRGFVMMGGLTIRS